MARSRGWTISRDSVLFTVGILGMINEVVFHHDAPQPQFLVIYVGFLTSIPLLRARDKLNGKEDQS